MTLVQDRHVTGTFLGGALVFYLVPRALILYFGFFFNSLRAWTWKKTQKIPIINPRPETLWDRPPEEPGSVE